jgi:hypothetical protein
MRVKTSMKRFLLLLVFVAPAVLAQGTLEIIPLRHRTVEQVLPVLRPLLEPGGAMSGQSNQLIVRTSPGNLADIRAALEAIDRPARRLMISVRFDNVQDRARSGIETDARISSRGSRAEVRIEDSRSSLGEHVDQRIQVLEGGRALISSGESRPLSQRQVIRTPGGVVVQDSTVIQDATTGFEVVPRVSGSTVVLEIAPQKETFAPGRSGAIQTERALSTVSGRLGEWIELGGFDSASARDGTGILSSRESRSSGSRRIWVRVEEVRP